MITLSEALSNFSGTTNYVAKYTPTGNVLGISQIFDNGTNVGIGTVTPTSKLQIIGVDSTSSNYSLKIDNSANSPLLYVRNDGEVSMNGFTIRQLSNYTVFKTSGNNGYLFNNSTDSINLARLTNTGVLILNAVATLNANVGLSVKSQGTSNLTKEFIAELYKGTTNNTGIAIASKEGVSYIQGYTTANTQTVDLILGGYNGAGSLLDNIILKSDGNVGIGMATPTSKLQIIGTDSTSSNYSLKIDNLANNPLFYVRNDGVILANNLPISSAGLPSGAIWNNSGVLNIV